MEFRAKLGGRGRGWGKEQTYVKLSLTDSALKGIVMMAGFAAGGR